MVGLDEEDEHNINEEDELDSFLMSMMVGLVEEDDDISEEEDDSDMFFMSIMDFAQVEENINDDEDDEHLMSIMVGLEAEDEERVGLRVHDAAVFVFNRVQDVSNFMWEHREQFDVIALEWLPE